MCREEEARQQQRELKKVSRDLGRDQQQLEREEKRMVAEIKKAARDGDEAGAKQLAKQLISLRKQIGKSRAMESQGASHQSHPCSLNVVI